MTFFLQHEKSLISVRRELITRIAFSEYGPYHDECGKNLRFNKVFSAQILSLERMSAVRYLCTTEDMFVVCI